MKGGGSREGGGAKNGKWEGAGDGRGLGKGGAGKEELDTKAGKR